MDTIEKENRIKLEIGCTIRLEPSKKMHLKTYFQEYLEYAGLFNVVEEFELKDVSINVLDITRTF
ncbi:hypothetical protein [Streptococcus mutans]|jgi:hypothetical protein|uniref:hypothetical protein n=1 Tax=Streptococcus mutans TaxID=1309 RepID=UPI0002B5DB55|nr:hypothetical protein [Streptococcus mutans]EMC03538.1 hypothetical protein SMU68_02773 [Streptococcus mutans NFSM1]MCB4960394.1 hypothetical protein [Streptococcus mutans]MCB5001568.1 hypothetical protein [Streptococcus mutans]MCB5127893.1 hypothetical protein [Streptococcus mutans]MCB5129632.1 hypothetical protein [Streptococcus mutans]